LGEPSECKGTELILIYATLETKNFATFLKILPKTPFYMRQRPKKIFKKFASEREKTVMTDKITI
jgi:hypothetical protein